jgi:hypothetical protein
MDVHNALSHLVSAAQTACGSLGWGAHVEWRNGTYLTLVIECPAKNAEAIGAKLQHGLLDDYNDYRFTCVSIPQGHDPYVTVEVTAVPDLQHDAALFARIPPRRAA